MDFILDIVKGIIETLHITSTLWIQFGLFFITFLFLALLVFRPYFKAFQARVEKTEGNQNAATQMLADADSLYKDYQVAARELNQEIRNLYDKVRGDTQKETDQIVNTARKDSHDKIEKAVREVGVQLETEKKKALNEVPEISSLIRGKLLGKEMNN